MNSQKVRSLFPWIPGILFWDKDKVRRSGAHIPSSTTSAQRYYRKSFISRFALLILLCVTDLVGSLSIKLFLILDRSWEHNATINSI